MRAGNYYSDTLDFNTGVWQRCDDDNMTQIKRISDACYRNVPMKYTGKK